MLTERGDDATGRLLVLITNHVLSGALTGGIMRRPGPAFLAGVASHFVLDGLPHWGDWRGREHFLRVAVADGLTGLAAMAALAAAAPPDLRAAVVAGMAGAALPDLDKPVMLWFGFSLWPAPVDRFHHWIQDEAADRFRREALAATVLAASALTFLRASRRHGGRRPRGRASSRTVSGAAGAGSMAGLLAGTSLRMRRGAPARS